MTIGIDIRVLARGTISGIEEYTINILSNMIPLDKNIKYKLFYNGYRKTKLNYSWLKSQNVKLIEFKIPNQILNTSFFLFNYPKVDKMINEVDLFFSPHIILTSVSKKCPFVLTFHDLSFERYSNFYSAERNRWHFSMKPKFQAIKADKIISVSKSTKDDLINLYNINPKKIEVVYSGVSKTNNLSISKKSIDYAVRKYNLPQRYILFLGTLEPRKNIFGIIKAFEKLKTEFADFGGSEIKSELKNKINDKKISNIKLVIAGSKGWLCDKVFKAAENSPFGKDIKFIGFVENKDKSILYKLASLFVYPSLYEGFGFPPLEAMACGTPVIASNFSSLCETVGNAAVMVDPYDINKLSEAMKIVLIDKKLRNVLVKNGLKRVENFNWKKCAGKTLDILTKTAFQKRK